MNGKITIKSLWYKCDAVINIAIYVITLQYKILSFIFQKFTKAVFFDIMKLWNFLEREVRRNGFTRNK